MVDETLESLTTAELRHIVWDQMGLRVSPDLSRTQLHDLLQYKLRITDLPKNPVNEWRDSIIGFIKRHKDQLSLPCNGNCYEHSDGVVVSCWRQLLEDTDGNPDN